MNFGCPLLDNQKNSLSTCQRFRMIRTKVNWSQFWSRIIRSSDTDDSFEKEHPHWNKKGYNERMQNYLPQREKRTWVSDWKISNRKQMCERTGKLATTRAMLVRIPYLDQWEPPELLQTERKCRFTPWQQGPVLAVLEVPTMCWTAVNSKSMACIKSGFAFIVSFHALRLICIKHMHEKKNTSKATVKMLLLLAEIIVDWLVAALSD